MTQIEDIDHIHIKSSSLVATGFRHGEWGGWGRLPLIMRHWARFESRAPLRLTYSKATIPKLCLFICWPHTREASLSEEQPAPAGPEVELSWEPWRSHPLSATDLLCGPDKLQMAPCFADWPCPAVVGHHKIATQPMW